MDSLDLLKIWFGHRQFAIRLYPDSNWGFRQLSIGKNVSKWKRFAIDVGRISFIFENYSL